MEKSVRVLCVKATGRLLDRSYHHYAPQACDIVSWIMIRKLFSSTTIAVVTVRDHLNPFFFPFRSLETLHQIVSMHDTFSLSERFESLLKCATN